MTKPFIMTMDNVLPYDVALAHRQYVITKLAFKDVQVGKDLFKGIAVVTRRDVIEIAEKETGCRAALSFYRKSPFGQVEPNDIHSDEMMGKYTGIYYMNEKPPERDGTLIWSEDADGDRRIDLWVKAKFNRLLIFDAKLLHSRAIYENYGTDDTARLIQVIFLK